MPRLYNSSRTPLPLTLGDGSVVSIPGKSTITLEDKQMTSSDVVRALKAGHVLIRRGGEVKPSSPAPAPTPAPAVTPVSAPPPVADTTSAPVLESTWQDVEVVVSPSAEDKTSKKSKKA